jgi:hypothetical protein
MAQDLTYSVKMTSKNGLNWASRSREKVPARKESRNMGKLRSSKQRNPMPYFVSGDGTVERLGTMPKIQAGKFHNKKNPALFLRVWKVCISIVQIAVCYNRSVNDRRAPDTGRQRHRHSAKRKGIMNP